MATEFISNSWLMPTNANAEANRVSNYSLDFDSASSQYISINSSGALDTFHQNPFSISFWFKTSTGGTIILSEKATSSSATSRAFYIYLSGGVVIWYGATASPSYTNGSYNDGNWHHIACVAESDTVARIYIDGVDDTNKIAKDRIGTSSVTAPIILGTTFNQSGFFFNGSMTEFSIFDYALSASQVTELYGTGSAIGNPMAITNGRKPISYYPLGNSAFNGEFLASNGAEQDYVFDFDGTNNQLIDLGTIFDDVFTGDSWTVSSWIYASANTSYDNFFNRGTAIQFYLLSNKIKIFFSPSSMGIYPLSSIATLSLNTWYNIVFTRSGNENKLYINGSLDNSATSTGSIPSQPTGHLTIGSYGNTGNYLWEGKISNCSVFNAALPATGTESVASLYNYGTPPNIASYSNLQGWWELNASATFDGSNWSIPDASSNSNTGTSSGMTVANLVQSDLTINAPYDSFSLAFDGVNDYVEMSSGTYFDFGSNDFSFSVWFTRGDTQTGNDVLFFSRKSTDIPNWQIRQNVKNIQIEFNVGGVWSDVKTTTNPIAMDTNWHHLAITKSGTSANIYIDGVSQATSGTAPITIDSGDGTSFIGSRGGITQEWYGKISNCSIYSSALTSAQIKTLYNEGKPFDLNTFAVTPVSWWRLGSVNSSFDGSNWTVLDEISTSGNNGVSANMTQSDLVDGVGATGSGTSSGMSSGTNKTGDAPYSSNNAVSYNMSVTAESTSVPT